MICIRRSGFVRATAYNREPTWGAAMAASTIATLPIAGLFIFLQRYFIKGLTAAAVKG
jgi:ABC-type glycerol-3-phosphate transport system permease component